ncbi:MAG TPA: universal stress protein [Candidatus Dormibacteraeota bacterium]
MSVLTSRPEKRRSVFPELGARPRVLVPVLKGQAAIPIVSIGDALLAFPGASGTLLALVEADPNLSGRLATQDERRRDMLRWVASLDYDGRQRRRMRVTLRVTADVAGSIRDAVADTEATSLVLEWPTTVSPRRHRLRSLTTQFAVGSLADVLFVRSDPVFPHRQIAPRSILAPVRGGPGARAVAATAGAMADAFGSTLTMLNVQSRSQHPDRTRRERRNFAQIVEEMRRPTTIVREVDGESAPDAIFEEAAGHDLVIMGSWLNPEQPQTLIGRGLSHTVRRLLCPVVVVRPKNLNWDSMATNSTRGGSSG